MVLKPAEITLLTAIKVAEIFEQAGLPSGVFNIVLGAGEDVGDELVQHPDVHAISFTGSKRRWRDHMRRRRARYEKAPVKEMDGKNPGSSFSPMQI